MTFGNVFATRRFWQRREPLWLCFEPWRHELRKAIAITCETSAAPIVIPSKIVVVSGMKKEMWDVRRMRF